MKKINTGVWLDFKNAYIFTFEGGDYQLTKVESLVEHHSSKGGDHPKSPWGPQLSPDDDNMLNREKQSEHRYFRDIIAQINPKSDKLVIFGPAEAKIGLRKEILDIKHYHPKLEAVLPSDYMTEREMAVLVRDYFLKEN